MEINTLFLLGKNCFGLNKVIGLTSQSRWLIDVSERSLQGLVKTGTCSELTNYPGIGDIDS